jgi:hypothetical protein
MTDARCTAPCMRICPHAATKLEQGSQEEHEVLRRHVHGCNGLVCKVPYESIHDPRGCPMQQGLLTIASAHSANSAITTLKIAAQPTPTHMPTSPAIISSPGASFVPACCMLLVSMWLCTCSCVQIEACKGAEHLYPIFIIGEA